MIRSLRLRTDRDTTPTLEDSLTTDNPSDSRSDNPSDNLKPAHSKESDNPDNLLTSKLIGIENQILSVTVDMDDSAKSFDVLPINEPEPYIESSDQVVSEGCQPVVSEVISKLSDASAPTKARQPAPGKNLSKVRQPRDWGKSSSSPNLSSLTTTIRHY